MAVVGINLDGVVHPQCLCVADTHYILPGNDELLVQITFPSFYYPNVATLRSGLCYCKSVCLSSVTFVRRTQRVETFGSISLPFCTSAIL